MLKNLKKAAAIVLSFAMAVQFGLADSYYVNAVVVLRAKCKNVANKMQKIGFKKRHFKRLLSAK